MARPDLEKKIKEAKEKYGDKKPESFDKQVDRVKAKYTHLLEGGSPSLSSKFKRMKKAAQGPTTPLQKGDVIDLRKPKTLKDLAQNEHPNVARAPVAPTAAPGVSREDKIKAALKHQNGETPELHNKFDRIKNATSQSMVTDTGVNLGSSTSLKPAHLQKDADDSEGVKALRANMRKPHQRKPGSSDDKIAAALRSQGRTNPYAQSSTGDMGDFQAPAAPAKQHRPLSALQRMRDRIAEGKDRTTHQASKMSEDEMNAGLKSLREKMTRMSDAYNSDKRRHEGDDTGPEESQTKRAEPKAPHPKSSEEGRSASERMLSRVREAAKKDKIDLDSRKADVYKEVHGDKALELRQAADKMGPAEHTERAAGSNSKVKYHGADEKGRHHFTVSSNRGRDHNFVMTKNPKGKADVEHVPGQVQDHQVKTDRGTWKPLDVKMAAKDYKRSHDHWGTAGMKSAATRVKQSGKFAELVGKQKMATPHHPKDFEEVRTTQRPLSEDGFSFSVRQKHGGSNYFNYKYNPKQNAYTYHDYSENEGPNPRDDKGVFEHIIKPSAKFKAKHKDGPEPRLISDSEHSKETSPLKIVKSAKMEKSMKPDSGATHTLHGVAVKLVKSYDDGSHALEIMEGKHKGKWTHGHGKELKPLAALQKDDPGGMKAAFNTPPPAPPPKPESPDSDSGGSLASRITSGLNGMLGKSDEPSEYDAPAHMHSEEAKQWHQRQADHHKKQAMHHELNASKHDDPRYSTNMAARHEDDARIHNSLAKKLGTMKKCMQKSESKWNPTLSE